MLLGASNEEFSTVSFKIESSHVLLMLLGALKGKVYTVLFYIES